MESPPSVASELLLTPSPASVCWSPRAGVGGLSQAAGFPAGAAVVSVALKKASSAEELASCSFVFDFLVNPKCASRFACLLLDMRDLLFSTEIEQFLFIYI